MTRLQFADERRRHAQITPSAICRRAPTPRPNHPVCNYAAGGAGLDYRAEAAWTGGGLLKSEWLADALAAGQLLVTRRVRRACALYALAAILQSRVGSRGAGKERTTYQALGLRYEAAARDEAATLRAEIDTNGDGRGDVAIDLAAVRVDRA